jgi:hypothetical protein
MVPIVDLVRVEVHILEALKNLEEKSSFVKLCNRIVEVELFDNLSHVGTEARDIVSEVRRKVRCICKELLEVITRRVIEGIA